MEEHVRKLLEEETRDLNKLKEERQVKVNLADNLEKRKKAQRSIMELEKEEKRLKEYLNEVKRENFELRMTANSHEVDLKKKMIELKEAESELTLLYREIWEEREKFCEKAGTFDEQFGLLSNWWKAQMKSVDDLMKFGQRQNYNNSRSEEKKTLQQIQVQYELSNEKIEQEIKFAAKENAEVNLLRDGESEEKSAFPPESNFNVKKVTFSCDEEINCDEDPTPKHNFSYNRLFSLMDVNKMKIIKRKRNLPYKNKIR